MDKNINFREENINGFVFLSTVPEHNKIKDKILSLISETGKYSNIFRDVQKISNTDWHVTSSLPRPYIDFVFPIFDLHNQKLMEHVGYNSVDSIDIWYQQYESGDFHTWHTHKRAMFSNIYYVDLPDKSPKTTFKVGSNEFEINIKEGDILSFPSYLIHCSKPNKSNKTKTIISFNSNFS